MRSPRARLRGRVRRSVPQLILGRLWRQYLKDTGWTRSVSSLLPEDADGRPLPWFTYAATAVLGSRVCGDWRVFEYGAGQSTRWWAERVAEVVAVEHHPGWAQSIRDQTPANVTVVHAEQGDRYQRSPLLEGGGFDVVVIDGRDRVACAPHALKALTAAGVIIWDNADVRKYAPGIELIEAAGFRRLDLTGLGPINTSGWTTAVLYRDGNCLRI